MRGLSLGEGGSLDSDRDFAVEVLARKQNRRSERGSVVA